MQDWIFRLGPWQTAVSQCSEWHSKLLAPVGFFAELVYTGLWAILTEQHTQYVHSISPPDQPGRKWNECKVGKILKGSLDSIPSPSHLMKIQCVGKFA